MGDSHNDIHALSAQFGHGRAQGFGAVGKTGIRARRGQLGRVGIGQPHQAHLAPGHVAHLIGAHTLQSPQGTGWTGGEIGGQHRRIQGADIIGQNVAALIELVVAQGYGVVSHQAVQFGQHGPLVDGIKQGALKTIAGVQHQHIIPARLQSPQLRGQTPHAAGARLGRVETGGAVRIHARHVGMGIVDVHYFQLKRHFRRRGRQAQPAPAQPATSDEYAQQQSGPCSE